MPLLKLRVRMKLLLFRLGVSKKGSHLIGSTQRINVRILGLWALVNVVHYIANMVPLKKLTNREHPPWAILLCSPEAAS